MLGQRILTREANLLAESFVFPTSKCRKLWVWVYVCSLDLAFWKINLNANQPVFNNQMIRYQTGKQDTPCCSEYSTYYLLSDSSNINYAFAPPCGAIILLQVCWERRHIQSSLMILWWWHEYSIFKAIVKLHLAASHLQLHTFVDMSLLFKGANQTDKRHGYVKYSIAPLTTVTRLLFMDLQHFCAFISK